MPRVSLKELRAFGTRLLVKKGVPRSAAAYVAEAAVTTEAAGLSTHGIVIFGVYDSLLSGTVDPRRAPRLVKERGATALIDGRGVMSHRAMKLAVDLGTRKARKHGIAMIAVRDTNWLGGLGAFLLPLARQGFFAQLWAQSSKCLDGAPYGGIDARFATDPVAIAFPTAGDPVVADFSMCVMSMGKVNTLIRRGQKASAPVFLSRSGRLTDDPRAMDRGGAMLLWGGDINGYKGYAFALWDEALTAMAGGSCNNPKRESRQSFNLTVVDPAAFGGMTQYRREMKRYVAYLKTSRVRKGFDGIRLPGERMLRQIEEAEKHGIELSPDRLADLGKLAAKNGVEPVQAQR
jgi:hydroxycarboxylate dehydrogenase B